MRYLLPFISWTVLLALVTYGWIGYVWRGGAERKVEQQCERYGTSSQKKKDMYILLFKAIPSFCFALFALFWVLATIPIAVGLLHK